MKGTQTNNLTFRMYSIATFDAQYYKQLNRKLLTFTDKSDAIFNQAEHRLEKHLKNCSNIFSC